jgi:hypothetical protein
MRTREGFRDSDAVWQGSSGLPIRHGVGEPLSWIATPGGMINMVVDIDVPAVAGGGVDADWTAAGQPGTELIVVRYYDPADTSKKLHGKGHLAIVDINVWYGAAVTGLIQPDTSPTGGIVDVEVTFKRGGDASFLWAFNGVAPSGSGIKGRLAPTIESFPKILSNDYGSGTELVFTFRNSGVNALLAGRYRAAIRGYEL